MSSRGRGQRRGIVVIETRAREGSRAVQSCGPLLDCGRGGSDPSGPARAARRGSRIREIGGVAPPSPATPLLTPDAANIAASRSTSPRHKIMVNQGLDGVSSARSLSSSGPAKGPAEGPTGGPPGLHAAGPRRISGSASTQLDADGNFRMINWAVDTGNSGARMPLRPTNSAVRAVMERWRDARASA